MINIVLKKEEFSSILTSANLQAIIEIIKINCRELDIEIPATDKEVIQLGTNNSWIRGE